MDNLPLNNSALSRRNSLPFTSYHNSLTCHPTFLGGHDVLPHFAVGMEPRRATSGATNQTRYRVRREFATLGCLSKLSCSGY